MLATTEENFFSDHAGEFDLILNTISADIPVNRYLRLLKPRGVMAVVGLPPEKQQMLDRLHISHVLTQGETTVVEDMITMLRTREYRHARG